MSTDESLSHHAADPEAVATWVDVGDVEAVRKQKKTVVDVGPHRVVVVAHDDGFYALDDVCIHRQRELHKGVVLKGRLVCPGHQWAFDLQCGWEAVKGQCQPTYHVRVVDGVVQVDARSRTVLTEPPS